MTAHNNGSMLSNGSSDAEFRDHVAKALRSFALQVEAAEGIEALLLPLQVLKNRTLRQFEAHLEKKLGAFGWNCLHCAQPCHEQYMVLNHIWHQAVPDVANRYAAMAEKGLPKRGLYLHLRCLEKRIGRVLTLGDLNPSPINEVARLMVERERRPTDDQPEPLAT